MAIDQPNPFERVSRFLPREEEAHPRLAGFENENIRYLDAGVLSRPLDMTPRVRAGMLVAMAAAAVIGGFILFQYFDAVVNAPQREQAALEENLARDVSLELPALASFVYMSDEEVMGALNASDTTIYERVPVGTSEDGSFEVIKLPEGVSIADAGVMYLTGIENLSTSDMVKLLNGAWTLTVNHSGEANVSVHYADFASLSVQEAVQSAIEQAGLGNEEIVEAGVDDSGNTYAEGTVSDGVNTCSWRVSAISLDEVYEISGIPSNATYVGIRFAEA